MKNILVALDLRAESSHVVQQATELAQQTGAKLHLLHVAAPDPDFVGYEAGPQYIRDVRADQLRDEHGRLQHLAGDLTAMGISAQPLLTMGPTVETILGEAKRCQADLIIMGTHGRRGLAKAFLGSTCDDVLRSGKYPVLAVPTPAL